MNVQWASGQSEKPGTRRAAAWIKENKEQEENLHWASLTALKNTNSDVSAGVVLTKPSEARHLADSSQDVHGLDDTATADEHSTQ